MDIPTTATITTTLIAALVAIITWRQWVTNRARLRHELFDRRYEVYQQLARFLAGVLQSGAVESGDDTEFLRATKQAYFVFGCDHDVRIFVDEIYKNAAYSGESVHLFRRKASTRSEDNRPVVLEETVRAHRSAATLERSIFQSFYSLSSLNAVFS